MADLPFGLHNYTQENNKASADAKGKGAPPPADYTGAAEKQSATNAKLNRPDISTPYASQQWTQGPDGQWQMNTGFSGPLAGAAGQLNQQAADALNKPFDLSGLPELDSGAGARQQAIDSAMAESTKRLDPRFAQEDTLLRSRLANQGLDPDSEAGRNATTQFGQYKNDAYGSAMNSAIAQGTAAGDSVFRNSAMARQMALAEALRKRGQPLAEMGALQSFLQMPGYNQVAGPDYFNAALAQGNDAWRQYQHDQEQGADAMGGVGELLGLGGKVLPFLFG